MRAIHNVPDDPIAVMRAIWGNADTLMLVFAGSAAEFALNRAVDWLFYTGKVPHDPIGRLFATASFAQDLAFADEATARRTLDRINRVHRGVERQRGMEIPAWSHRDVLYMLIDYSRRAFELLYRPLCAEEMELVYGVARGMGEGLHIPDLPPTYAAWLPDRERHLERDLAFSDYTAMLYAQYRRHLGPWRYALLLQLQGLLAPERVRAMLKLDPQPPVRHLLRAYPLVRRLGLRPLVQRLMIPPRYLADVRQLDAPPAAITPGHFARA